MVAAGGEGDGGERADRQGGEVTQFHEFGSRWDEFPKSSNVEPAAGVPAFVITPQAGRLEQAAFI
jgi:hypothetical protein